MKAKTNICVMSTYDLDLNVLDSIVPQGEDLSRYVVFHGAGLFEPFRSDGPDKSPRQIAMEGCIVPSLFPDGYMHGKLKLTEAVDETGAFSYSLEIGSANIFHFKNKEIQILFSGEPSNEIQEKSIPVCTFLLDLCSFMDKSDPRRESVLALAERFRYVRLAMEGPYQSDEWSIIASCPSSNDPNPVMRIAEDYDQILVVAPNVNLSVLQRLTGIGRRRKECILITRRAILDEMLLEGPLRATACSSEELCDRYIHAKVYLCRKGGDFELLCGSMNPTYYGLYRNFELSVSLAKPKGLTSMISFLADFLEVDENRLRSLLVSESVRCKRSLEGLGDDMRFFDLLSSDEVRRSYLRHLMDRDKEIRLSERKAICDYILSDDCRKDIEDAKSQRLQLPPPERREICQNGKKREVYVFPMRSRCFLGLVGFALKRHDGCFSDCLYSHRLGVSAHDALIRFRRTPPESRRTILKTDIHSYDPSIDRDRLFSKIDDLLSCNPDAARFLKRISCSGQYIQDGVLHDDGPAVMSGSPLAGFFENLYLSDLDHMMEKAAPLYIRYADDILVGVPDKDSLNTIMPAFTGCIKKEGLTLSENKTMVIDADSPFVYLSWQICGNDIDIPESTVRMWRQTLRREMRELADRMQTRALPPEVLTYICVRKLHAVQKNIGIRRYFRLVTTDRTLRRIDRITVDEMRRVISGHSGKERYKVRYRYLRRLGYRSLVSQYYGFLSYKKRQ